MPIITITPTRCIIQITENFQELCVYKDSYKELRNIKDLESV